MAFPLSLVTPIPALKAIDVGASPIDGAPPYQPLMAQGGIDVVGFEPSPEQFAALQTRPTPGCTFLPHAVGDGTEGTLRVCRAPGMTSLLEPNFDVLKRFHVLAECAEVVERIPMATKRLDDLPEVADSDYLKIDVQGSELAVLQGAPKLLKSLTVVHIEVNFVPFYVDQPLFAELDQALRDAGFYLHKFLPLISRVFKPLILNDDPYAGLSQVLWTDAVYVRKFTELGGMSDAQLLKTARIAHEAYGSFDLCAMLLHEHDERVGGALYAAYLGRFGGS
jgi:FkbM family methyltransferase